MHHTVRGTHGTPEALRTLYSNSPGPSCCPAPQVRTARKRQVRVVRKYSTEAPGRTCQHREVPRRASGRLRARRAARRARSCAGAARAPRAGVGGEPERGREVCRVCGGGGNLETITRGKVLLPRNTSMENRQCTGIRLGCDSILPACALARRNRHTSAYRARAPHPQPSHLMKAESFAWNSSASIAFCRKAKAVRDAMVGARGELERGAVAPADRLRARSRLSSC